ncbi:MAG: hypothetical protein L0Z50_36480 [Verrucomicrobiales bacterium]|nr:hypothetical protein [Verrucomicrobiales bacterium]
MSEYQYYEFQAIDRRLSDKEIGELRGFSSRAEITPTSFINEYSFGSFKGNANAWMEKYFEAYLYVANWGTHELQLRLPAKLLPLKTARLYCAGDVVSAREKSGNVILRFFSNEEGGGDWVEADGLLSSMLRIRDELARGDLRSLYLGWLRCAGLGELDDKELEPPVPPDLGTLSAPLESLAEFLRIDPDWLAVAAESSSGTNAESPNRNEMADWVAALPLKEKNEILVRLMEDEDAHLGTELNLRFRKDRAPRWSVAQPERRTVADLLTAARSHAQERQRSEARKAAAEKERREREAALAREKHLAGLNGRVPELWTAIEELVATRQAQNYDLAVQHLVDLRDLAARQRTEADFANGLAGFRDRIGRKPSLISRLTSAGL